MLRDSMIISQLKHVLERFNQGYIERDVNSLDTFMEELFVHSSSTTILGTSDGELCLGFEPAKTLIKNDWLYWGDFRLDPEQAISHPIGEAYWFAVVATVQYVFNTNDTTHERMLGFIRDQLAMAEQGSLEGLTTLAWGLAHYSFPRPDEERVYQWPVRLTGVIRQEQGEWKFQYMQYCLPSASSPDQRRGTPALDYRYGSPAAIIDGFEQSPFHGELVDSLQRFVSCLASGDIDAVIGQFNQDGLKLVIAPQDDTIQPGGIAERLTALRDQWGELSPCDEHVLTFSHGDLSWVVCDGTAHQTLGSEAVLRRQMAAIKEVLGTPLPAREKVFQTQVGIATVLKDIASGSDYRWPCRLELAFSRAGEKWCIEVAHLSFPFYWIFEDKIPALQPRR